MAEKITVKINTIDNLKQFAEMAYKILDDITVYQGKYVIDGKSILGLMSLNLNSPIIVEFPYYASQFKYYLEQLEKNL